MWQPTTLEFCTAKERKNGFLVSNRHPARRATPHVSRCAVAVPCAAFRSMQVKEFLRGGRSRFRAGWLAASH